MILGALNYKVLVPIIKTKVEQNIFYLQRKNKQTNIIINAQGQKTRDGFVVSKGSYIIKENMKVIPEKIRKLRQVAKIDENRILQEDLLFNSPSYAAAFITGGNTNGLIDWETKEGIHLKNFIND